MEIIEVCHVRYIDLYNTSRNLIRELKKHETPPSALDYVPRFAGELNLSTEIQSKAVELIKQADENVIRHYNLRAIATTALFIASDILGEHKSLPEVAILQVLQR